MKYEELFQLKDFQKAKLLTGDNILLREITGAHVIEMADGVNWAGIKMVYRDHRYKNRYQNAIKRAGIDARCSYCGLYIYNDKSEISNSCTRA